MNEQQNIQTIKDAYAAFARGDIQSVLSVLTDDVEWETQGAAPIPYAGVFLGKDGVTQFFRILADSDDAQVFEPRRFFADGDMVVVLGRYAARVKKTGRTAEADWVHAFTFRDGKVAKYCEYYDTAKYAQAYVPAKTPAGV
jgi:ketosteroid isomerase-like protein